MTLLLKNITIETPAGNVLLDNFTLSVENGLVATLMGPSGCGKSTLFNFVAGHLSPEFDVKGEIWLNGKRVDTLPPYQRSIGILFQDDLLFPHLRIWENLAFALPDSVKGAHRRDQARQALENASLSELADAFPHQISGGQKARISLIRMLLAEPQAILLDEPFSQLDASLRARFRNWVFQRIIQAGIPALMVTHDRRDAPENGTIIHWPGEAHYA